MGVFLDFCSNNTFDSLFHKSQLPLVIYDRDGIIRLASDAWLCLFQTTNECVIGKPICSIYCGDIDWERCEFKHSDHYIEKEIKFTTTDGIDKYYSLTTSPLPISDNESYYLSQVRDVTLQKRSEEAYKVLVKHSLQGMVIMQDNKAVYINDRFCEITGYSHAEVGQIDFLDVSKFVVIEDLETISAIRKIPWTQCDHHEFEIRLICKSGEIKWLEIFVGVTSFYGTRVEQISIMDISAHKNKEVDLLASKKFIQKIADAIPVMIVYYRPSEEIIFCNMTLANWFDYIPQDIVGTHLVDVFGEDFLSNNKSYFSQAQAGVRIFFETELADKSQEFQRFKVSLLPDINEAGEMLGAIAVLINISDYHNVLSSLNEAKRQMADIMESKDKFFSIIAHDLRGPIASFNNALSYLKQSCIKCEEKNNFLLSDLYDASGAMYELLEELLLWARSQDGNMQLDIQSVYLKETVESALKILRFQANKANIKLLVDIPFNLTLVIDAKTFKTTIRNLVSNSLKFTPEGGAITISTVQTAETLKIIVDDTGIGMDKKTLLNLFSLRTRPIKKGLSDEIGSGLGLLICQEFVQLNGGKIVAESTKGSGSRFIISFPV